MKRIRCLLPGEKADFPGISTKIRWFKESFHIAQLSIFLSSCKGCGEPLVFSDEARVCVCRECRAAITLNRDPRCRICGRIMGNDYDRCGECTLNPPPFRIHVSYSRYHGLLKDLILVYKYSGVEKLKNLFVDYYIELVNDVIDGDFDAIVPVPPDRSRKREFRPILEAAKILCRRLGIKLLSRHLVKIKETPPQAGLNKAKRTRNLDGAFKLKSPREIKGKKILLIDDVYTTGTTLGKCALLLSKHAADVAAMTLARS
jgi:ComF family protein